VERASPIDLDGIRVTTLERTAADIARLSESPGETRTRVLIHRLGFAPPVLQVRFVDEYGEMFPDFFWPDVEVALEFDGKVKYTRGEFTGGDPSGVVWREKLREDRLRRQIRRVERATFADITHPARLERILHAAGVPRVRAPFAPG
jgi:hypothetical protein